MITQIQAIIRSEVNNGNIIGAIMTHLNNQVVAATSSEKYVTLFYGELNTRTGDFEYCNAGHNYPVLVRSDGTIELLIEAARSSARSPACPTARHYQRRPDDVLSFSPTDSRSHGR